MGSTDFAVVPIGAVNACDSSILLTVLVGGACFTLSIVRLIRVLTIFTLSGIDNCFSVTVVAWKIGNAIDSNCHLQRITVGSPVTIFAGSLRLQILVCTLQAGNLVGETSFGEETFQCRVYGVVRRFFGAEISWFAFRSRIKALTVETWGAVNAE